MGLPGLGSPLSWDETKLHVDEVRKLGIKQLIAIWEEYRGNDGDVMLWGDEVEYLVVSYDDKSKNARLSLKQEVVLEALWKLEQAQMEEVAREKAINPNYISEILPKFHPECGRFMLESTPGSPYGVNWGSLLTVEDNMKLRRRLIMQHLADNEALITMTSFPRLGAPGVFTDPHFPATGLKYRSQYLPDELISVYIRFGTIIVNARQRRGSTAAVNVPVFYDVNTPRPFQDPTAYYAPNGAAQVGCIFMDAVGFGMGCCCLQITLQAKNLSEARTLYDQLVPIGPLMLALTAAAPIFKGFLADVDVRWDVISESIDDRTEEERGLKPLKNNRFKIPKPRYASVSTYISDDPRLCPEYNDPDLVLDEDIKKELLDHGMDERLASHFAHLFIRDPLALFRETLDHSPERPADHFENIQSTNWQHMRFKPPPPGGNIGWRVEFRIMEIQFTDFENAAFAIFIALLTRVILSYGLNFYIPIAKVDENMCTAHARDAVLDKRFWFRKHIFPPSPKNSRASSSTGTSSTTRPAPTVIDAAENEYTLFTINEIFNGTPASGPTPAFIGLIPLVESYLNAVNISVESRCQLSEYLDLIRKRASGELMTSARWIREFVRGHEEYKGDSKISERINYDLVKIVEKLGMGRGNEVLGAGKLLGRWKNRE